CWDTANGKELWRIQGMEVYADGAALSPDGQRLATVVRDANDNWQMRCWDTASGDPLPGPRPSGTDEQPYPVAFSADGKTLAAVLFRKGPSYRVVRWDVATERELGSFALQADSIGSTQFSPDGKTIVTGGSDRMIRIWDAPTGQELRQIG